MHNFLFFVPFIFFGYADKNDLDKLVEGKSEYSTTETKEGIVIKNYRKQMRGKLVRPDFLKDLEEDDHWMLKPVRKNKLRDTANVYD